MSKRKLQPARHSKDPVYIKDRLPNAPVVSLARWRIILSPIRLEILEAFRACGPCSIAKVADLIDRSPDALHRHVRVLTQAKYLQLRGTTQVAKAKTRVYDVAAEDFYPAFPASGAAQEQSAFRDLGESFFHAANRALIDAAKAKILNHTSSGRNFAMNLEMAWLTPQDFSRIRRKIVEIKKIMDRAKRPHNGQAFLTIAMAIPLPRRSRKS